MKIRVETVVNAPREKVWQAITDIENSVNMISGIEKIEVLEQPDSGLEGLKWRETRTMFGKTATEVMWISDVSPDQSYRTRAESHGSIYLTYMGIEGEDGNVSLFMEFAGRPVSFGAKLMSLLMGWMFKGATKKALAKDLEDIKNFCEK